MTRAGFVLTAALAIAATASAQSDATAISYKKALGTEYLREINPTSGKSESAYVAPAAAAMGLSWLVRNGFPDLLPRERTEAEAYEKMKQIFASNDFMRTEMSGTAPANVIYGIEHYIQAAGYEVSDAAYGGWRLHPKQSEARKLSDRPDFDLLRKGVDDPRALVIMNVGYYRQAESGKWRRRGGNWLTVVGYGAAGDGPADPSLLLVHNPMRERVRRKVVSNRSQDLLVEDIVHLKEVDGTLYEGNAAEGRDGHGLFSIAGPAVPERAGELTIVESVIAIKL